MSKILVIGQAPPAVRQKLPYDTTMFYDWLAAIGIDKNQAQNLFEFDAVYGKFPGRTEDGSHAVPSKEQMDEYWDANLGQKMLDHTKIWIVGNVARDYLVKYREKSLLSKDLMFTMHPSKRNMDAFRKVRAVMLDRIKRFIYG